MKKTFTFFSLLLILSLSSFAPAKPSPQKTMPKIQVAILLDVSNSMDGLIAQAKTQLWNMVSILGNAKCDDSRRPDIEIALYEYGRPANRNGIKQISGFTSDLDALSKKLFALTTNGGEEYCGQVIFTSLKDLAWDKEKHSYKTIFIAGNEDFLQGNVTYTLACNEAMKKGVIVNTIYCGNREQGIREHWNLGAECGKGSYTNIDHNLKEKEIPTPYDKMLFSLNDSLNSTYVYYGNAGRQKYEDQAEVDADNIKASTSAALQRVSVKANKQTYRNSTWDLVEAEANSPGTVKKIEMKTLPKELQSKNRAELAAYIKAKQARREEVQKKIEAVNKKRQSFIAEEKKKNQTTAASMSSAIEHTIRSQVKRVNMSIE